MGQDHEGLESRNQTNRKSHVRHVCANTIDRTEKVRTEATADHQYSATRWNDEIEQQYRTKILNNEIE